MGCCITGWPLSGHGFDLESEQEGGERRSMSSANLMILTLVTFGIHTPLVASIQNKKQQEENTCLLGVCFCRGV